MSQKMKILAFEPGHSICYSNACASSEDSDIACRTAQDDQSICSPPEDGLDPSPAKTDQMNGDNTIYAVT